MKPTGSAQSNAETLIVRGAAAATASGERADKIGCATQN
jgi:hypothetical protein